MKCENCHQDLVCPNCEKLLVPIQKDEIKRLKQENKILWDRLTQKMPVAGTSKRLSR